MRLTKAQLRELKSYWFALPIASRGNYTFLRLVRELHMYMQIWDFSTSFDISKANRS